MVGTTFGILDNKFIKKEIKAYVVEILEDPTKEEIEKKINKLKDEKIIIRSYYDDDNYVDSSEITLKHIDNSKNPKTNDNMPIYIGAAISSLLGLSIIGLYIKKNKNSI